MSLQKSIQQKKINESGYQQLNFKWINLCIKYVYIDIYIMYIHSKKVKHKSSISNKMYKSHKGLV